jgi:hypothetical protein
MFVKEFQTELGKNGKAATQVTVTIGRLRALRLGPDSFELPAMVRAGGNRMSVAFAIFNVDRIASFFIGISAPGRPLTFGSVARLNRLIAARVPAGLVPASTALPSISGTPQSGQTLTLSRGSWTNEPTKFEYQWLRCDASGGACAPTARRPARTS